MEINLEIFWQAMVLHMPLLRAGILNISLRCGVQAICILYLMLPDTIVQTKGKKNS